MRQRPDLSGLPRFVSREAHRIVQDELTSALQYSADARPAHLRPGGRISLLDVDSMSQRGQYLGRSRGTEIDIEFP